MRNRYATAAILVLALMTVPLLRAQTPTAQSPTAPQWQTDAGGKMAFEVASVKPNKSNNPPTSSFPLGPGDAFTPTGGLFSATNEPLIAYLRFAFKLGQSDLLDLPAWVYEDRFDIDARAQGNPTKDQMRLMMQALLADRFKLTTHVEGKPKPVFNLVLSKPGKTGPQLQAHVDNGSCSTPPTPQTPGAAQPAAPSAPSSTSGLLPPGVPCGSLGPFNTNIPGRGRIIGRSVTMGRIAGYLTNPFTGIDRPVRDRTGLTGTFDFSVEWVLSTNPGVPDLTPADTAPTFIEALQEQLGFKLVPTTGSVDVLVIDHVEMPSPN